MLLQTHSTMKVYRLNIRKIINLPTKSTSLCPLFVVSSVHIHTCGLEDPKKKKKSYLTQLRLHVSQIEKNKRQINTVTQVTIKNCSLKKRS